MKDYESELQSSTWRIEREGKESGLQQQMNTADKDAELAMRSQEANDPDYNPNDANEEGIEERRG